MRQAILGGELGFQAHRQRRRAFLERHFHVGDAADREYLLPQVGDHAAHFGVVVAQQRDVDRPAIAHAQFHAGHAFDALADRLLKLLLRQRAFAARHQLQVDARRVLAQIGAHADAGVDDFDFLEFAQHGLDAVDLRVRVFETRAHGHGEPHAGETFVGVRHHFGADQAGDGNARHQTGEGEGERGLAVRQRRAQQQVVDFVHTHHDALEQPQHRSDHAYVACAFRRIAPDRGQHRVEREAHEQRHQHRRGHGDAERKKELSDDAAHERNRHEYRNDGEGGREDGEPDLLGAFARRGIVVLAHVDVAHDVFAHHDGVVDQQPDAQAQRHQGHVIERKAAGVERDEGRDHRYRQRQAGDHGAAPGPQKQEHDQHRQQAAFEDGVFHVVRGAFDEIRICAQQAQFDPCRQLFAHRLRGGLQAGADLDNIRVLGLEDVEADRRTAVDTGQALAFLFGVGDGGDL